MHFWNFLQRISIFGLTLMLGGLGLVFYEIQTASLHTKLGMAGHFAGMITGTALSVWGLKECVARFWPRMGGRGYHFRIPGEGYAYLTIMFVLFVGSVLSHSNVLMMVFAVMVGSFVVNGWLTFNMLRGTRVQRELPARAMAGDVFNVSLLLENRNRWVSSWLMTVHDSIQHGGVVLRPEVLFVRVPPRGQRMGSYHLCPTKRGRYVFTHLDVLTRFPLGMVERGIGRDCLQELLVYPRIGQLRPEWRRMMQHSMELVSHSRPNGGTFQDDMHRIREFRPGDDRRRIHWRTTARMNELMVCEYHECRDRDLMVIVDAWLPAHPTAEETEQFEHGLRFATTICMTYLRFSRQSSLRVRILGKETYDWFGDSGKQHADKLLDALALLEPSQSEDYSRLSEGLGPNLLGLCRTLVISPRPQALRAELIRQQPGAVADLQVYGTSPDALKGVFSDAESPA